jgi:hypothetical protein
VRLPNLRCGVGRLLGLRKQHERARAFADLAAALCGEVSTEALPRPPAAPDGPQFRHRTAVPSLRLVPERLVP